MKLIDLPFSPVYFWSYKKDIDLPDEEIIERVLLYGKLEEMFMLLKLFGYERCFEVYKKRILPQKKRYPRLVNFLRIFFDAFAGNREIIKELGKL
ncbi:MAG: hypothetical protein J7J44_03430 [Deltaproteobacteria bacterium]|nr:hypothetical protein [Deltaproteobacteria bacterium]